MLTSIATIAGVITTIVALITSAIVAAKKSAEAKKVATLQDLNEQLKGHMTDAEREKAQNALNDTVNSK